MFMTVYSTDLMSLITTRTSVIKWRWGWWWWWSANRTKSCKSESVRAAVWRLTLFACGDQAIHLVGLRDVQLGSALHLHELRTLVEGAAQTRLPGGGAVLSAVHQLPFKLRPRLQGREMLDHKINARPDRAETPCPAAENNTWGSCSLVRATNNKQALQNACWSKFNPFKTNTAKLLLSFIKDHMTCSVCALLRKHCHLKESGVLVFAEVVLPSVLPGDAEHGFVLVIPHHTWILPTADLRSHTAEFHPVRLTFTHTVRTTLFCSWRHPTGALQQCVTGNWAHHGDCTNLRPRLQDMTQRDKQETISKSLQTLPRVYKPKQLL